MHCAGVLDDGAIPQQNWRRLKKVMAPKVEGAWNLHSLTKDLPLDHFVLFSSAASLLGSAGQSNHAAANSFLDQLACWRQSQGLPGLSINWGPWADVGSVARLASQHHASVIGKGLTPLTTRQGLTALGQAMYQPNAQIAVLPIDWSLFAKQWPRGIHAPLLLELVTEHPAALLAVGDRVQCGELSRQLLAAESGTRQAMIVEYLQDQLAQILRRNPVTRLSPDQPLNEIGLDSLMSTVLKNRLMTDLQIDISLADLVAGVSVAELAANLQQHLESPVSSQRGLVDAERREDTEEITL